MPCTRSRSQNPGGRPSPPAPAALLSAGLVSLLDSTSSPYPRGRSVLSHRDPRWQGCRAGRTFLQNKSSGYLPRPQRTVASVRLFKTDTPEVGFPRGAWDPAPELCEAVTPRPPHARPHHWPLAHSPLPKVLPGVL